MRSILFSIIMLCSFCTFAQNSKPVKLLLAGGFEFGGDEVAEVSFIGGGSQTVDAGQGGSVFIGGQFQLPRVDLFFVRAAVGYKYVTTVAENVNIRMTRIPLHLTGHYRVTDDIHVGGGLVSHQNVRFKVDDLEAVTFDNAAGFRLEAGWKGLALTYTNLGYRSETGENYDASSLGVSFSVAIPRK